MNAATRAMPGDDYMTRAAATFRQDRPLPPSGRATESTDGPFFTRRDVEPSPGSIAVFSVALVAFFVGRFTRRR